jgi:hypothetical protein
MYVVGYHAIMMIGARDYYSSCYPVAAGLAEITIEKIAAAFQVLDSNPWSASRDVLPSSPI